MSTPTQTDPKPKRGGDRITGSLGPGNYTRTQVADRVGMPVETLRRWLREGTYVPHASGREQVNGKTKFHVYTEDDVVQLRALCKERGVKHRYRALPPGA